MEYSVSEAAKMVEAKSHVLRYWEDELHLPIHRNDLGHRYYTQKDIQVFLSIKEMKKRGLQLKEIDRLMPLLYQEMDSHLQEEEKKTPKKTVIPEQFYKILEKLVKAQMQENVTEESHYKKLDAVIRARQKERKLIAVTAEQGKQKKNGEKKSFFHKKKSADV